MKRNDIDALARLLEDDFAADGEVGEEARALGALAQALSATARPAPPMERKGELRAALIEAAREQAPAPSLLGRLRQSVDTATARWRYSTRMAAATAASALALSGGGVAVAAQQSLPGDALYGVKLAMEDARLAFVSDDIDRAKLHLAYAERRLDEARIRAEAGDMDGVQRALQEADASGRAGARAVISAAQDRNDPALLQLLADFSALQRQRLTALLPLLDGDAAALANDALVVLNRIDQRVAVLSGTCTDCEVAGEGTNPAGRSNDADAIAGTNDLADFDFSDIPPASEPFAPCPCGPPASTGASAEATEAPRKPAREAEDEAEEATEDKPRKPGRQPDEPADDEEPGEQGPRPDLPEPVEEPVDEVEDVVDDVLDEIPDPPVPAPDTRPRGGPAELPTAPEVPLP